jgi:hypothetical protein
VTNSRNGVNDRAPSVTPAQAEVQDRRGAGGFPPARE